MVRKTNVKKRLVNRKLQKGGAMIIFALIVIIFTGLTIGVATKMMIKEKKRTRMTDISSSSLQGAEEIAECALWARTQIKNNCFELNPGVTDADRIFAQNIIDVNNAYCVDFKDDMQLWHQNADHTDEPAKLCGGPLWTNKILTRSETDDLGVLAGDSTLRRGAGVVAESGVADPVAYNGSDNQIRCCNKVAYHGSIQERNPGCDIGDQTQALSPLEIGDSQVRHHWLKYWDQECGNPCEEDICAFYNSEFDATALYNPDDQGAKWCFTYWDNGEGEPDITVSENQKGSLAYCMDPDETADKPPSFQPNYWDDPDAEGFCNYCHRLTAAPYNDGAIGGQGTGKICKAIYDAGWPTTKDIWGSRISGFDSKGEIDPGTPEACACRQYAESHVEQCCKAAIDGHPLTPHLSQQRCCQDSSEYRDPANFGCLCCTDYDIGAASNSCACKYGICPVTCVGDSLCCPLGP